MSGYSFGRIVGALKRRGRAAIRARNYKPGKYPVDANTVLFDSFNGKSISDSPLAIFQELRNRRPELKFYFTIGKHTQAPEGAIGVEFESKKWLEILAGAGVIVANNALPWYFKKQQGQTYVQTWHGTPLKRLGHDLDTGKVSQTYLANLDREATAWDYLISPSKFCSSIFPSAFAYSGKVLEAGYPRNDELTRPDAEKRMRIRQQLGVEDPSTILVLYAPTWRDYQVTVSGNWEAVSYFDPETVLPKNTKLMFRGHTNTTSSNGQGESIIDVTNHPNINDLFLASDVLLTDYSSVMFDYSVTGKPILFLVPDLERYRSERGFYFDFEAQAPGPLLSTSIEVSETLSKLPETAKSFQKAYKQWQLTFNLLEDGSASRRVVDAVWGTKK